MAPTPYPKLPTTAWKTLRSRAANAPSTKFTATTVAALLGLANPRSASDNIITPLRKLGLIEEDGSLTDRGNRWRIDATYGDACQDILDDVYPTDLAALTDDDGNPDKHRINTWLQHQGFGGSNARQMAATYAMIAEKKVPESNSDSSKPKTQTRRQRPVKANAIKLASPAKPPEMEDHPSPPSQPVATVGPNVHLDIQIHIPADASADQIDQIFASMAKHLYQR